MELDKQDNAVMVTVSADLAIRWQKEAAARLKNFAYKNDEQALMDYMVIHWAWFG